jgi:histidinol-phosphate aminotransferase
MNSSRRNALRTIGMATVARAAAPLVGLPTLSQETKTSTSPGGVPSPVFLDHNENAYGPSEKVLAVLRDAAASGNRYPRAEYDDLIAKLAALHSVKPEQIVFGAGSSEILRMAATTLLGAGRTLIQGAPTYPALGRFAESVGAKVVNVALTKMYAHDLQTMLARSGESTGLIYICNPNNPTGTLTPRADLETFIRKLPAHVTVLIDEAYHHFVGSNGNYASFLDRPVDDSRIVVCRTFSKVYGLAGLRLGYAVGAADVIRRLSVGRLRYGVSVISARAAVAALHDTEYVQLALKRNADDRQEFTNQVNTRMLRCLDSHTNFVMVNPMRPPKVVIDHLKQNNVVIAPAIPEMEKYIRVSLGTPAELQEFWRVIDLLPPPENMAM